MNNIEKVTDIIEKSFSQTLPVLNKLYGLRTEIYYPIANNSHYDNDSKFFYNSNPDQIKQVLITNSFQELLKGSYIYDPFSPDELEAIVLYNESLVINSKLKVYKGSAYNECRVDNNPNVITSNDGKFLYIRYNLIPII